MAPDPASERVERVLEPLALGCDELGYECGLAVDLPEAPPFDRAPLDTLGRSRVVAAGTPKLCQELFAALDG